jgi:hypothetical protein
LGRPATPQKDLIPGVTGIAARRQDRATHPKDHRTVLRDYLLKWLLDAGDLVEVSMS